MRSVVIDIEDMASTKTGSRFTLGTFQVYGDQLSDEDRRRELNEEKAGCGY